MTSKDQALRSIPKVDDLLAQPEIKELADAYSHALTLEYIRAVLGEVRGGILRGECLEAPGVAELLTRVAARVKAGGRPSLRRLINATGVVLHTNLGRAPLAKAAVLAVEQASQGYSNLEYDIESGERGSRHAHVRDILVRLTGAEDAMAVNNNAAAVLLAMSALTKGKEVVVSRGELVEIGGAFRVPEVMEQSGSILREVGTTNKTRTSDYEKAIAPERTGALLKVHTSNFRIFGFTEEASLEELADIGQKHGLPVIYDLGSGLMRPIGQAALLEEPTVMESLAAGADIVCFSGDKLLGGPQAGIIVGKAAHIEKIKRHPLARALRIDKMTLAALEATLKLYLDQEKAVREIPTLSMLSVDQEALRRKATRLQALVLERGVDTAALRVQEVDGQVGGGSAPMSILPSAALGVLPARMGVAELERRLRALEIPIIVRIARDTLFLDVRTIEEEDFPYVAERLAHCLQAGEGENA